MVKWNKNQRILTELILLVKKLEKCPVHRTTPNKIATPTDKIVEMRCTTSKI